MKEKLKEQLEKGLITQEAYDKALAELEEAEAYAEQVEESSEIQLKVGLGYDKPTDGAKVFRARAELKRVNKDLSSTKADIEKAKIHLADTLQEQGQNLNERGMALIRNAAKVFGLESKLPRNGHDCHISEEQEAEIAEIRADMEAFRDSQVGQILVKRQQEIHLEHGRCTKVSNAFGVTEGVKSVTTTSTFASPAQLHMEHLQRMAIQYDKQLLEARAPEAEDAESAEDAEEAESAEDAEIMAELEAEEAAAK